MEKNIDYQIGTILGLDVDKTILFLNYQATIPLEIIFNK
jgi:hypothetical protein